MCSHSLFDSRIKPLQEGLIDRLCNVELCISFNDHGIDNNYINDHGKRMLKIEII